MPVIALLLFQDRDGGNGSNNLFGESESIANCSLIMAFSLTVRCRDLLIVTIYLIIKGLR
jgi:hypothetical protein